MKQFESYASGGQVNTEWDTALEAALGEQSYALYAQAFSPGYKHDFDVAMAVSDIDAIGRLSALGDISVSLHHAEGDPDNTVRFRLLCKGRKVALSNVLPLLEDFGMHVEGERPYRITDGARDTVWVHEFELTYPSDITLDIARVEPLLAEAFTQVWLGHAESDRFNRLVLSASCDWRIAAVMRAYARYMKQLRLGLSGIYIADTLAKHTALSQLLMQYFEKKFSVKTGVNDRLSRQPVLDDIHDKIIEQLEAVDNLTEDKIIRHYLTLMEATLRTNVYQLDASQLPKAYFSFKFNVNAIPEAPKPKPAFEIFVYSPRVEGVHLRGGKVARGGLRWSDRLEDFRTEVLGLVKAQQVKNSVIVPVGAKGGFVCKQLPDNSDREAFLAEGVACYRLFISALLDVTDNLEHGHIEPPARVVRWDDDDPYLVVAADKGTATFSDIANEISADYRFWLGDAFASGGSVGYDHKKMGITAKGAWVSVQRHFRELGVDVQSEDFTAIAIGDMAGDVFGNGMLCSEHTQLLAAFNHMHIFVDPNPDAARSYIERKRLFELPRSSWEDYDAALISTGGGVFSRHAKSIAISPEMKAAFAIKVDSLTPNELIQALLRAPVDLLWNGGIGTYAKGTTETDEQVGDRANDLLRVNGADLGAKVIGEGGNLGFTQLARVEYCLAGGRCNTDFIDNAGGVDCSDHEVNIKILLNQCVASEAMTIDERNALLESMTEAVSDLVLENNYRQTQAISIAEHEALSRSVEYRRLISHFEATGKFDRELEAIPCDETIAERRANHQALTRPELSVLVSYSKLFLKQALVDADIASCKYLVNEAKQAFPDVLRFEYTNDITEHQLLNEIVSTQVAGDLVNRMGITFVHRMQQATGELDESVAKAYITARDLFGIDKYWRMIEDLDYQVPAALQSDMFAHIIRLVRRTTRWLLRSRRGSLEPQQEIDRFSGTAAWLTANMCSLLTGAQKTDWQAKVNELLDQGVPTELAEFVASARYLYTTFAVAEVTESGEQSLEAVAHTYFALGSQLELNWFADQIVKMGVDNYWQAMARESFRDDLEWQQRSITQTMLRGESSQMKTQNEAQAAVDKWLLQHETYVGRWQHMVAELRCTEAMDLAMFPVAIRELLDLVQASEREFE